MSFILSFFSSVESSFSIFQNFKSDTHPRVQNGISLILGDPRGTILNIPCWNKPLLYRKARADYHTRVGQESSLGSSFLLQIFLICCSDVPIILTLPLLKVFLSELMLSSPSLEILEHSVSFWFYQILFLSLGIGESCLDLGSSFPLLLLLTFLALFPRYFWQQTLIKLGIFPGYFSKNLLIPFLRVPCSIISARFLRNGIKF